MSAEITEREAESKAHLMAKIHGAKFAELVANGICQGYQDAINDLPFYDKKVVDYLTFRLNFWSLVESKIAKQIT